jgi:hypothetical protein
VRRAAHAAPTAATSSGPYPSNRAGRTSDPSSSAASANSSPGSTPSTPVTVSATPGSASRRRAAVTVARCVAAVSGRRGSQATAS